MKEKNLIEMKNKLEASTRVIQQLINEITHLRELSIGTLETVKLLPGYKEAIDQLKKQVVENVEQKKSIESNGTSE
tara:strand:- start:47 stop:274 length:228 start_codon:yes stop_codon:yes gene_type:complete